MHEVALRIFFNYPFYILHSIFYIRYSIFYILHSIFYIRYSIFYILHSIFYLLNSNFYFLAKLISNADNLLNFHSFNPQILKSSIQTSFLLLRSFTSCYSAVLSVMLFSRGYRRNFFLVTQSHRKITEHLRASSLITNSLELKYTSQYRLL